MAVIESDVETVAAAAGARFPRASTGPITAARRRRSLALYAALCVLGQLPLVLGASPGWQAIGLGLLVPGGGFHAWGLVGLPLALLTLGVFWIAIIVWFWCGMVLAPLAVWLGAALLAGAGADAPAWPPGVLLAYGTVAALALRARHNAQRRRADDAARGATREAFFADSLREVVANVRAEPAPGSRELDPDQLSAVRYLLDRALQPVGEYAGYTIIDQFQPAALRYQINHLGYALAMVQCNYTPSFSGYLGQAQRNLVETYLNRRVWDYWVLESMWGHLNFSNFDPADRDNIMLTGYYGMQVNQYMLVSGDRRYAEPGSLTFRLDAHTAYAHDAHSLVDSVRRNHARSDFCLFPCEPNWIYAVCNLYGMGALATHDAVFGTRYLGAVLPRWQHLLDTEFTDGKGSLIPLRSQWLGFDLPFYAGEAGFAFFANVFSPALAARLWAVGRRELGYCIAPDAEGRPRLSIPPEALSRLDTIDPGNYRRGALFAYAAVAMCAREFGDDALAEAALRAMDQDCGRVIEDGVARYTGGSGWANIWAVNARLMRTGDFRKAFVTGPPASVFAGPRLCEAPYPDVLVAQAFSDGSDLSLVLYPGRGGGEFALVFDRLRPGVRYVNRGATSCVDLVADARGTATLTQRLSGRTSLRFEPV